MPCEGAVSNICTGYATGEACIALKTQVDVLPQLDGLVVSSDGTSITIDWETPISYPDQIVRGHVRDVAVIGYGPDAFQLEPRNDGQIIFPNLISDTKYRIWIRVENDTQVTEWLTLTITTIPGTDIPLDYVLHNGVVVLHKGELVVF